MSKAFTLKVEGEKELIAQLQRFLGDSKKQAEKLVENTGYSIANDARAKAPTGSKKTSGHGNLKNSIIPLLSSDRLTVTVGTRVDYAPFVEYGTRAMEKAHGSHGTGYGDNFVPTDSPITSWEAQRKRGASGQQMPFLTPAFLEHREKFMKHLRKMLESETRKRNR